MCQLILLLVLLILWYKKAVVDSNTKKLFSLRHEDEDRPVMYLLK